MQQLHAIVTGRVQGVGFRDYVCTQARRLNLRGWVRNTDDSVEVVAEGENVALAHLVLVLEKGPPLADIDEVDVTYSAPTGEFDDFRIRF